MSIFTVINQIMCKYHLCTNGIITLYVVIWCDYLVWIDSMGSAVWGHIYQKYQISDNKTLKLWPILVDESRMYFSVFSLTAPCPVVHQNAQLLRDCLGFKYVFWPCNYSISSLNLTISAHLTTSCSARLILYTGPYHSGIHPESVFVTFVVHTH
jgi:hypothetical protein